jgi:hypothetical protein
MIEAGGGFRSSAAVALAASTAVTVLESLAMDMGRHVAAVGTLWWATHQAPLHRLAGSGDGIAAPVRRRAYRPVDIGAFVVLAIA